MGASPGGVYGADGRSTCGHAAHTSSTSSRFAESAASAASSTDGRADGASRSGDRGGLSECVSAELLAVSAAPMQRVRRSVQARMRSGAGALFFRVPGVEIGG